MKNMPEPGKFLVCEKRCPECLYTPAKIVGEERKQELLDGIQKGEANYFVCHKGSLTGNDQLCCRGWYDDNRHSIIVTLAEHLGVMKFVPVPKVGEKK